MGKTMKLTNEQKKLIREGIFEKIMQWYVDRQYWKIKNIFDNDPELKKIAKSFVEKANMTSKKIEDYCKKYGCDEPTKHTKPIETAKELAKRTRR